MGERSISLTATATPFYLDIIMDQIFDGLSLMVLMMSVLSRSMIATPTHQDFEVRICVCKK